MCGSFLPASEQLNSLNRIYTTFICDNYYSVLQIMFIIFIQADSSSELCSFLPLHSTL